MQTGFLSLMLLVVFTACKKQDINIDSFWQCNQSQHLDSTAIAVKLTGSWTWNKRSTFSKNKPVLANKNIKVTFSMNQTFVVYEDGTAITQGTWKLILVDSPYWGLALSSPSEYLYGRILFCENQVLFNDSYVDGYDNLFDRSN